MISSIVSDIFPEAMGSLALRRAEELWTERSLQASGQGCAVPLGVRKHSMIWELQTTH